MHTKKHPYEIKFFPLDVPDVEYKLHKNENNYLHMR